MQKLFIHLLLVLLLGNSVLSNPVFAEDGLSRRETRRIYAAVLTSAKMSLSAVAAAITQVSLFFTKPTEQMHADLEKQNVVNKALVESQLDVKNQVNFQEKVSDIQKEEKPMTTACEEVGMAIGAKSGQINNQQALSLMSQAQTKMTMNTNNQALLMNKFKQLHLEKFCSEEDAVLYGCQTAPIELQNADLDMSHLFEPSESNTYSSEEDIAAQSYALQVANPFATQTIPNKMSTTPQGQAFIQAQMQEQRMLSLVNHSFNEIYTQRRSAMPAEANPDPINRSLWSIVTFSDPIKGKVPYGIQVKETSQSTNINQNIQQAKQQGKQCEAIKTMSTAEAQDRIDQLIPSTANESFASGTCLDSIFNTRINIFTFPSLDGILDNIMNQAKNAACAVAMNKWNRVVGAVNQQIGTNYSLPYVGQVGGVNVGQGTGNSPVNVNNGQGIEGVYQGIVPADQASNDSDNSIIDRIKALF